MVLVPIVPGIKDPNAEKFMYHDVEGAVYVADSSNEDSVKALPIWYAGMRLLIAETPTDARFPTVCDDDGGDVLA